MKPILFNTDMVKAILDGRKSVTRRVVKPPALGKMVFADNGECIGSFDYEVGGDVYPIVDDAPYQPGDILYVRETWALVPDENHDPLYRYCFKADNGNVLVERWRPSIHMPKEAARLFLRVTEVRVERLREIDNAGARAEGCDGRSEEPQDGGLSDWQKQYDFSVEKFQSVWDSTIKKADLPRYGWDANPWTWVIEFERISKEEALTNA